jgi:serine/threonine-protein kinase HipA
MKLAMFVGDNRHYRLDEIKASHFLQTAKRAGLPKTVANTVLEQTRVQALKALELVPSRLPAGFPEAIHASTERGVKTRLDAF